MTPTLTIIDLWWAESKTTGHVRGTQMVMVMGLRALVSIVHRLPRTPNRKQGRGKSKTKDKKFKEDKDDSHD